MGAESGEFMRHGSSEGRMNPSIPVDRYIERYGITDPKAVESLKEHPILCYLLGSVSYRADEHTGRPAFRLTEGAGMFGLQQKEDALRWKGLFNHIVGAAGNVQYLSERIANASPNEMRMLERLGYTRSSVQSVDPSVLRDHKLIDHAGRRAADEYMMDGVRDHAHPSGDSEQNTIAILKANGADPVFIKLMNDEDHDFLLRKEREGRIGDIRYGILTYGDWTFGQDQVSLADRFAGLRSSHRTEPEILDRLERIGATFESDLAQVFGQNVLEDMKNKPAYAWQTKLLTAYASSAGLDARSLFPALMKAENHR